MKLIVRRAAVVVCAVLVLATAVAAGTGRLDGVPDWLEARERSAPMRRVLHEEFGARLGRVKVAAPLNAELPEYDSRNAGVTLELTGGVHDADLCAAMVSLHRAGDPPAPILSVTVIRPDDGMVFESLHWDPRSGRLLHLTGGQPACECMLVEYLDGRQHACAFSLTPEREVPLAVDSAALERYADGQEIPWTSGTGG